MSDQRKTKKQLIDELVKMRKRVAEFERAQGEWERVEEALRASDERYRALLAAVPDLILRVRRDGTFLDYSPSTEFTTYVPPDRFLGAKMQDIMPSEMVERTMEAIERVLEFRTRETVQYHLSEPEGVRHYEARISVGGRHDTVCIIRDITERKETENALRESEKRYRELFENSKGLICTHDLDGKLLSVNAAAAQSLGYEPEELVGRNLKELLAPEVRRLVQAYLKRMRRGGFDRGLMRVVSKDGEERTWTYRNVVQLEEGRAPYVIGHALDVTELRRAEKVARTYETRCRALYERAPFGICQLNAAGMFVAANPRLAEMLGYESPQGLVGLDVADGVCVDRAAHDRFLRDCCSTNDVQQLVTEWRKKDGRPRAVQLSGWALVDEDGELECIEMVVE